MGIASYRFVKITLGNNKEKLGHAVYPKAKYTLSDDEEMLHLRYQSPEINIIFKENKYGKPEFSVLEVAFSELAHLFLEPDITPKQLIVKDEESRVLGSASEHITYTIARHEPANLNYFQYQKLDEKMVAVAKGAVKTADIPYHFFNKLPVGMFRQLIEDEKDQKITINFGSLASVLTSSYTLEEDDLHKGNFGFYAIEKDGKPHIVFFKIDHDLMLTDSVMSHHALRLQDLMYGKNAFKVTERDLVNFPNLTDSHNFYWPTIKRVFHGIGNKAYTDDDEIKAFSELATSEEFCRNKWQEFYKHVLIPAELIQQSLANHLDQDDPKERARCALITQAVVARQAKLRAVLFSIPQFREFVLNMDDITKTTIIKNILQSTNLQQAELFKLQLEHLILFHKSLCEPAAEGAFTEGDTPLHAAIRLQDFRYHETWDAFSQYAETENAHGDKALDIAVELHLNQENAEICDARDNSGSMINFLVQRGVQKTQKYYFHTIKSKELSKEENFYVLRAGQAKDIAELKQVIRDIGEDFSYCLKMQKDIAIDAVKQFISAHRDHKNLRDLMKELKIQLNGRGKKAPAPELQFIRQLRSQLWIVRYFRGMFGSTSTLNRLNHMIDKEISRLTPSCCKFFSKKQDDAHQIPQEPTVIATP